MITSLQEHRNLSREQGRLVQVLQNRLRRTLRWAWIYLLYGLGLIAWARLRINKGDRGIIVLTLHRVLDEADFQQTNSPLGMIIRRETFEDLLRHLQRNYETVALTGAPPSWERRNGKPRFAVTFDDGWKDTCDVAAPLAEKFKVPVTVFVCPGLAGQSSPFWPEKIRRVWLAARRSLPTQKEFLDLMAELGVRNIQSTGASAEFEFEMLVNRLKEFAPPERERILREVLEFERKYGTAPTSTQMDATMTWEDTVHIKALGSQIGSHTQNHQILPKLPSAQTRKELCDSKLAIQKMLGCECTLFAYPNGSWSKEVRELVIQAGYSQAFSNETGVWTSATDSWVIPRVNIWEGSVSGPSGRFSPVVFEYATFWRSLRADIRARNPGVEFEVRGQEQ